MTMLRALVLLLMVATAVVGLMGAVNYAALAAFMVAAVYLIYTLTKGI